MEKSLRIDKPTGERVGFYLLFKIMKGLRQKTFFTLNKRSIILIAYFKIIGFIFFFLLTKNKTFAILI